MLLDYTILGALEMGKLGRTLSILQKWGSFVALQTPDKALHKHQIIYIPCPPLSYEGDAKEKLHTT